jgi:PAS domain S-box-containing protein
LSVVEFQEPEQSHPVGAAGEPAGLDEVAFRRLAELSPDALIAHRGGKVVWLNESAAALTGLPSAEAAVGLPIIDFVAPESRATVAERVRRMAQTGEREPLIEETFLRADDGRRIECEVAAAPIGKGLFLVAVRDVTARKQAERERLHAETRFRAFFEAAREAMGISLRGVHVLVNPAYARLFGFERPQDLVGRSILDLIAPAEQAQVVDLIHRRTSDVAGTPGSYDVRARRVDGSEFLLEVRASSYASEGDVFTVVVLRDVTKERDDAARLEERERRYRELFDQVPVGVWEEDLSGVKELLDGLRARGVSDLAAHFKANPSDIVACARAVRVLDVNANACETAAAKDKAELFANLDKVFRPESMEGFAQQLVQLVEGRRITLIEGWNGRLDGGRRWVVVRGVVAAGHEADWSRVVITTVDVTERRQAREEKARLEDRLRHAEKLEAVGRLAGGVAHDFNNILAAILGFAELSIEETSPGSSLHDSQLHIREAARRARDLIRQILTFGRRDRTEQKPVDVAVVVGEALALARAGIPATVEVATHIDPTSGAVLADPTQLHQIVLNLCSNARDAVGERGRIEVTLAPVQIGAEVPEVPPGRYVQLRIRDDGAGMDQETRARLFEPYMTTKGSHGGHGLGLAVVHGIVAGSGGAVRVESAPGQGATFDVYFPRLEQAAAIPAGPAESPRGVERILLVDDEPLVRAAHRRTLQSLGYIVTEARDGQEALELLRAAPGAFDLVLTDQSMPRLSGADLARLLLAEQPAARIILCTGYSDAIDEDGARALGVKALLDKPIDRWTLAVAVREALDAAGRGPGGISSRTSSSPR